MNMLDFLKKTNHLSKRFIEFQSYIYQQLFFDTEWFMMFIHIAEIKLVFKFWKSSNFFWVLLLKTKLSQSMPFKCNLCGSKNGWKVS